MATVTITTNPAQDARIAEAVGSYLMLGRDATMAEVKGLVITHLRDLVINYERNKASNQATAGVTPVDLT